MTDDLFTPLTPATPTGARRRPHRHRWLTYTAYLSDSGVATAESYQESRCTSCGRIRDEAAARRGRQSRNYGNRAELAVAKTYGGTKVGHAGGPTDVAGPTRKLQIKTLRRAVPAMWRSEFAKLDSERDGRLPLLLLRFLRPGNVGPEDFLVIRGADFLEWYGKDEA